MIKYLPYTAAAVLLVCLVSGVCRAESVYVKGITKITMRTEPGVAHKIIAMLETGTPLETIEKRADWSRVKTEDGKTGWVLTRFITMEKPGVLLLEELKRKNETLSRKVAALEKRNESLSEKEERLTEIREKYAALEKRSTSFPELEEKNREMKQALQEQKETIEKLEARLQDKKVIWFLAGAGVFIFGILLGMSARRKKRSSLL